MIVVSNTSPITNLAAIGKLDLLRQLYHRIAIPDAVYRELTADGGIYPGAVIESLDWIEVVIVENRSLVIALQAELDEGEAEAIALAQSKSSDLVLMDEHLGRAIAVRFGLRVVGILGVLVEAKNRGLVEEVKPLIDALMMVGFRIGRDLYARVLQAAGE